MGKKKKILKSISYSNNLVRVTIEMKSDLVDKVKKLSNEGLTKMVAYI